MGDNLKIKLSVRAVHRWNIVIYTCLSKNTCCNAESIFGAKTIHGVIRLVKIVVKGG